MMLKRKKEKRRRKKKEKKDVFHYQEDITTRLCYRSSLILPNAETMPRGERFESQYLALFGTVSRTVFGDNRLVRSRLRANCPQRN